MEITTKQLDQMTGWNVRTVGAAYTRDVSNTLNYVKYVEKIPQSKNNIIFQR